MRIAYPRVLGLLGGAALVFALSRLWTTSGQQGGGAKVLTAGKKRAGAERLAACPSGKVVVGVSQSPQNGKPHALLCCNAR